jgi:Flp pilus assembly protein TadG
MVEAAFALVLFLGFVFLVVDACWGMFAKVTLQHAVRSGVRYAVTSQDPPIVAGKSIGYLAAVKQVVQRESMGLLSTSDLDSYVTVTFYSIASGALGAVQGTGANSAGNLIVVSVKAWPLHPLGPLLRSSTPVSITVSSGDLIETVGNGTTPPDL